MMARCKVTSKGGCLPRRTVSTILELTGPRILSTASDSVRPMIGLLSIWTIRSPGWMPALAAGVPSMGDTTLITPFSIVTSMPSPPNSPLVCTCMSSHSLGSM